MFSPQPSSFLRYVGTDISFSFGESSEKYIISYLSFSPLIVKQYMFMRYHYDHSPVPTMILL